MSIPQVSNRPPKASSAEVDTGTNDSKYITPLSLANSGLSIHPVDLKLSTASKGGVFNGGFELAPAFTAATSTMSRWVDGTAGGSTTNDVYGIYITQFNTATGSAEFDSTVAHSGKYSLKLIGATTTNISSYLVFTPTPTGQVGISISAANSHYYIPIKASTSYRFSAWVKTSAVTVANSGGFKFTVFELGSDFSYKGAVASASFITGTTDWTLVTISFTSGANSALLGWQGYLNGETGTVWIDDIKLEEVVTDTTFTGKVAEKIRPVLQAVTSTDNIDNSLDSAGAYANTYALTDAVNEGATHIQTFTPTKKYTTQIGVWCVAKGTGVDWTLVVHTAANAVVASKLIAAASLVEGAMNYFDVPNIWTTGALHFHLYASATTGTPTCKANTSDDLETASYIQRYTKKTEGFTLIQNGVKTELKSDKDGVLSNAIIDLDNGKYRYDSGLLPATTEGSYAFANNVFSATYGRASVLTSNGINDWKLASVTNKIVTQVGTTDDTLIIKVNTILPIKHLSLLPDFCAYTAGFIATFQISADNVNYTTLLTYTTPSNNAGNTSRIETDLMNGLNVFYIKYNKDSSQNSYLTLGKQIIDADLDTSSIPTGLFYPLATNQFTETVKLPSTADRLYFQSAKYTNEYGVVVPALEFCSTATPVGYVPLKLDNSQETSPCVSILSTTTNYQQSGTGSNVTGGYVLNTGEYITLTSAVAELKVDYQVGTGTTAIAAITKNTMYLSSNGEGNDSTQDPSHQANFIVGVRQQGLTDRVKDLGNEIAGVREGVVKSSKWTDWTPTLTWTTGTPEGSVVTKARYKIVDGVCNFTFYYSATDGNGATALTISLPVYPKDNDSVVSLSGQMLDDTNWNNPLPYIEDGGTTIVFREATTAGDGFQTVADTKAVKVIVTGSYEI